MSSLDLFYVSFSQGDRRLKSKKMHSRLRSVAKLDSQLARIHEAAVNKALFVCYLFPGSVKGDVTPNGIFMAGIKGKEQVFETTT